MPLFIREANSPHWYELQASHLSASMQANFSHNTSLQHNCQCLNVSHVFIVSVTAPYWCILHLFINILWNTGKKHTVIQTVIKLRKLEGKFISDTSWMQQGDVYSTEFIFIHSFSKKRKYRELLKVLLVVPQVFKNKTSNLIIPLEKYEHLKTNYS
jgi:hypothetical protein